MAAQLEHTDWLAGRVPASVRTQIRTVVEVLGYVPHEQPLAVVTADGITLAVNVPLLDLVGCPADELLESDWAELMPGWDQRTARWDESGEPDTHAFDAHLCCAGARRKWAHVVAVPVTVAEEVPPGLEPPLALAAWTVFVSDDSPRSDEGAERVRRETAELLLDSPGEYAVKLDAQSAVEFVSPSLCRIMGARPAELVGRSLSSVRFSEDWPEAETARLWEDLSAPPYRAEREIEMGAAGDARSVAWTFEALLADGGALQGVFGLGRDVTEHRAAERAARRRLGLETTLAAVSSCLSAAEVTGLGPALDYALGRLGEDMELDAVAVHELSADGGAVVDGREWRRHRGITTGGRGPRLDDVPWLRSRLERHEIVSVAAVDDLPADASAERGLWQAAGHRSVLVAPLVVDARLGGFLTLATQAGARAWRDDDHHVVRVMADQVAAKLVWAADSRNVRVVSETLLGFGPDFSYNLAALCAAAGRVTGADFVLYCRQDEGAGIPAAWKAPPGLGPALRTTSGTAQTVERPTLADAVCRGVLHHGADDVLVLPQLHDSVYAHTSEIVREHHVRAFIGYPVRRDGGPFAALIAFFRAESTLRASQLELVRMLGRAAAVEESRRLAQEETERSLAHIEEAMERTVAALSKALGARDPYTEGHELRVAALAAAIGAGLGLGDSDVRLLRLAATVHDIGKIVVPAEFLSKPTPLTDGEVAMIRQHAQAGHELLREAALPEAVLDAVVQHHERLDGSGYPHGLAGDEIGLFGRIIAVADVAEAMSSHRPYRPALGPDHALAELQAGRGSRFDDAACDVCFALLRDGGFDFDAAGPAALM